MLHLESVAFSAVDDVQRKLDLIDKQVTGGFAERHRHIISTSPLIFAAVGLIVGILLQEAFGLSSLLWLILLAAFAVSTVLLFVLQERDKLASYVVVPLSSCALICFACLGAVRLNSFYRPRPDDIRNCVTDQQQLATIRGLIVTDPHVNKHRQWKFAKFMPTDPTTSFYLKVSEAKTIRGWTPASGTVRVQVDEPILDLKAGDYIQAYCWLDRFKPPTNPGQFDTAKYLARKGVLVGVSIKSRDGIELLSAHRKGIFTRIKRKIRQTATIALLDSPVPEDQSEGLLQALLLGYRGEIDSSTYRAFRKTGLLHFISLSGMHLGIFVGIIWWLCKTAGLMKPTRAIICIIAVAVFLLIVPPRPPTLRAAIIAWVFCASFLFRRYSNSVNTLSLAAIILLLIRPTQLYEPGWQLSFSSVLGIILFTERIESFIYREDEQGRQLKGFLRIIPDPRSLFAIGLAAWLGGAGILLYHFHTITPLTPLWTVAVFVFVALILTIGYLKMILSFLLPTVAAFLGIIVTGLADLLIWIVERIASLDASQVLIGHVSPMVTTLYYCLIIFAAYAYLRRPLMKRLICIAMALTIIVNLGLTRWQRTHRNDLILTCLDVSHGQAILAQLPGKANVLFDAGSLHKRDVGRRIVTPFLDYTGISKIDAIIVTHDDIDHINGIPEIVEHCGVGGVYANDAFFTKADKWGTARFLSDCLSEGGIRIQRLSNDLNLGSKARVQVLWPSEQLCQDPNLSNNDKSVVSMIEFAGKKILVCSDIEKFAQGQLLQLFPNLKADIVVVPHHGSARTADPDFLESLNADILICSCGRREYERLNRATTPTNVNPDNTKLFYTARDGAITIRISEDGTLRTHSHTCGDRITSLKADSHGARDPGHEPRI